MGNSFLKHYKINDEIDFVISIIEYEDNYDLIFCFLKEDNLDSFRYSFKKNIDRNVNFDSFYKKIYAFILEDNLFENNILDIKSKFNVFISRFFNLKNYNDFIRKPFKDKFNFYNNMSLDIFLKILEKESNNDIYEKEKFISILGNGFYSNLNFLYENKLLNLKNLTFNKFKKLNDFKFYSLHFWDIVKKYPWVILNIDKYDKYDDIVKHFKYLDDFNNNNIFNNSPEENILYFINREFIKIENRFYDINKAGIKTTEHKKDCDNLLLFASNIPSSWIPKKNSEKYILDTFSILSNLISSEWIINKEDLNILLKNTKGDWNSISKIDNLDYKILDLKNFIDDIEENLVLNSTKILGFNKETNKLSKILTAKYLIGQNISFQKLLEKEDLWRQMLNSNNCQVYSKKEKVWNSLTGNINIDNYDFISCNNIDLLRQEGFLMKNCVVSYYQNCISGISNIYSLQCNGNNLATIDIRKKDNFYYIDQIRGKSNSKVSSEILHVANNFIQKINNKEILVNEYVSIKQKEIKEVLNTKEELMVIKNSYRNIIDNKYIDMSIDEFILFVSELNEKIMLSLDKKDIKNFKILNKI